MDLFDRLRAFLSREETPGAGDWNLDVDLEAGRALDNQIGTDNSVSIRRIGHHTEDNSYTPHLVTIGPYHRSSSSPWMEKEKQRCVGFMQNRSEARGWLNGIVQELERQARVFYGHRVAHMTAEELARILLHDGCYLLRWLSIRQGEPYRFGNTEHRDVLYLIENQMPFSALEQINQRALLIPGPLMVSLADYVGPLLVARNYISGTKQRLSPDVAPRHLLHLMHTFFYPTSQPPPHAQPPQPPHPQPQPQPQPPPPPQPQVEVGIGRWRRATDYRINANLKFKCRGFTDDVTCVLDVHLERGTLWIPCLKVDSKTWTLLRNLMALEEEMLMPSRPVTAYCIFMSQVACTVEDVRLLVAANIVQHFLASDEIAAQGFADLCNGVVLDVNNEGMNYLRSTCHDLEMRCGSRRRNFKGSFLQKYCSNGLHRVAFGITVLLTICQLLQAVYASIAYHLPKKGS